MSYLFVEFKLKGWGEGLIEILLLAVYIDDVFACQQKSLDFFKAPP